MNRQTSPAEVLDELIHWMSQQLSQRESPTHDHGAPSGQRGHNPRNGATRDSAARYASPPERTSGMN